MHFFTSANINYLPKARVLAKSLKCHQPNSRFTLMLCERANSVSLNLDMEPFDQILFINDLDIPVTNLDAWIFTHTVVELCTAVKPFAFSALFLQEPDDTIVYLDPDIKVFNELNFLEDLLKTSGVIITPHLLAPTPSPKEVVTHEISCLKHGTYNLGFLAVNRQRGKCFVDWWKERLLEYCYDEIPRGLFTDQRWIDLAPCFFKEVYILRDTSCNVASWNVSRRNTSRDENGIYFVDGAPLKFFHFSSYDSGLHDIILERFVPDNAILKEMSKSYCAELEANDQFYYQSITWSLGHYNDSTPITRTQRRVYRDQPELAVKYPNPYSTYDPYGSYIVWYIENIGADDDLEKLSEKQLKQALRSNRRELCDLKNSKTYRWGKKIADALKRLGIYKSG